jgi:hypothetical protein
MMAVKTKNKHHNLTAMGGNKMVWLASLSHPLPKNVTLFDFWELTGKIHSLGLCYLF